MATGRTCSRSGRTGRDEEPSLCSSATLIDLIEQDVVFSCNLLCRSYAEIREWPPDQRRLAIENSLKPPAI